ncbi:MAG: YHYH protein [bacterium]|nr:YHYH protein [bacterium]
MNRTKSIFSILFASLSSFSQLNPAITNWLINTTNIMGRHYVAGNSTPINDNVLANVQTVQYSSNFVYVSTQGIPAYITGPFQDGNPSLASAQNAIFKISLNPIQNTGTAINTTGGNIGIFINGVALFDYRDGVSWNNTTMALCGGPGNSPCPGPPGTSQAWNRDAVIAEKAGFDCSKAHPAMGNYHHHQNPSAFNLDLTIISSVCNLYAADGLYKIDSTKHSPLIGYAYDGFPIYGAYAFKNANGTGGVVRMKSSYILNTGTSRTNGPNVSTTYPLGYFREDYQYIATSASTPDYLDAHNGRFCVTPEYPNGIYCYFATVDKNWNSAYPYVVGPTFYGTVTASKVTSITEAVTTYSPGLPTSLGEMTDAIENVVVFPNPASDFVGIQLNDLNKVDRTIELYDLNGKLLQRTNLHQGSTVAYFDTRILYGGEYLIRIPTDAGIITRKVILVK